MARMGQEDVVVATRNVLRGIAEALDVPVTVLQKELAKWNNVALNQLHDLLKAASTEIGVE